LDVVHRDEAVEAARELRRDEALELGSPRAASEAAGDEDRLVAARDAGSFQLVHRCGDRELARVVRRAGERAGRRLDADGGPPARDAELFLVDGNNLAYRAFYALPEELVTSEGVHTNALLGFSNMLFKLLVDYHPKAVAVAWDTRPVHRTALAATYKEGRKPM